MAIESANTLKTLGINILGKFLTLKDANSKYVSLFMLQRVLNYDINTVQKHRTTILDCLKENDLSIKQLALNLVYLISNESNVKSIIKELLNYLLQVSDADFMKELTLKICAIIDKHSPNRRWHIDTVINYFSLSEHQSVEFGWKLCQRRKYIRVDSLNLWFKRTLKLCHVEALLQLT